jgi:hypothetical protein
MAEADLYSIYMADEPTAEEYAAQLAQSIRGRQSAASLGALGSPRLQKFGAQQAQFAVKDQAELGDVGKARLSERRMGLQQAATQRNYEAQRRLQEQEQAAQARNWQDQRRLQERGLGIQQQLADYGAWQGYPASGVEVNRRTGEQRPIPQGVGGRGGAGGATRPLPNADRAAMELRNSSIHILDQLEPAFQDTFAGMPLTGGIRVRVNQLGIGDQDRADWWSKWQKFMEIPVRHEMFGSALTPTEKAAWNAAERVRLALQTIREATLTAHRDHARGRALEGVFSVPALQQFAGNNVDLSEFMPPGSMPAPSHGPSPQQGPQQGPQQRSPSQQGPPPRRFHGRPEERVDSLLDAIRGSNR